jgi:hypothetical protein
VLFVFFVVQIYGKTSNMKDIKEKILAHARSRKSRYADRMTVFDPDLKGLPAGLTHYSIDISQLFDYIPINYIVAGDEYFTSLQKGDYARLLKHLRAVEDKSLSAMDLAILFLLLEYPSRDRRIVERPEDVALPPDTSKELREQLAGSVASPSLQVRAGELECIFHCFNIRTNSIEKFSIRIPTDYNIESDSQEVIHF